MPWTVKKVARRVIIYVVWWVSIVTGLIVFGTAPAPKVMTSVTSPFAMVDWRGLPAIRRYKARDGAMLSYREYPGTLNRVALLIHGSSGSSLDMHKLAMELQRSGITVIVPDLRGHGANRPHGDINYLGQLDDDIWDLIATLKSSYAGSSWSLLGFSSGGGFALRLAADLPQGRQFSQVILLSPYLHYDSPSVRSRRDPSSAGTTMQNWASVSVGRVIGLRLLHVLQIHFFDGLPVVRFAVPVDSPVLTSSYSWRLQENFSPHQNYHRDLQHVSNPAHVFVGGSDELLDPKALTLEISSVKADLPVSILPSVTHSGMVTSDTAIAAIVKSVMTTREN